MQRRLTCNFLPPLGTNSTNLVFKNTMCLYQIGYVVQQCNLHIFLFPDVVFEMVQLMCTGDLKGILCSRYSQVFWPSLSSKSRMFHWIKYCVTCCVTKWFRSLKNGYHEKSGSILKAAHMCYRCVVFEVIWWGCIPTELAFKSEK